MIALWFGVAAAGELTCVYRGVPMQVTWDAAGRVTVEDGPDTIVEVQAGEIPGTITGRCREEGIRVTADVHDGHMTISTLQIDFGAMFDTMPARFSAERVHTRKGLIAAKGRSWAEVRAALDAGADRATLLDAVIRAAGDDAHALAAARTALPQDAGLDLALARSHLAAGRLEAARALVTPDSVVAGEVLWAAGEKGPARKVWMAAAARGVVLPEHVRALCPRCPTTP